MYVCIEKNIVYIGFGTLQFQASIGGLGTYVPQKREDYCIT